MLCIHSIRFLANSVIRLRQRRRGSDASGFFSHLIAPTPRSCEGDRSIAHYPEGQHASTTLRLLGETTLAAGDPGSATQYLSSLVNRFEYSAHVWEGRKLLARAYLADGRMNEAGELYSALAHETASNPFAETPDDLGIALGAASAYRAAGRTTEAKEMLYGILGTGKGRGEAFAELGMIAKDEGNVELATAYFRQAAAIDPEIATSRCGRSSF